MELSGESLDHAFVVHKENRSPGVTKLPKKYDPCSKKYLWKEKKLSYGQDHESCLNKPKLECMIAQLEGEGKTKEKMIDIWLGQWITNHEKERQKQ